MPQTSAVSSPCEVSWFAALCDDDYEFLGVPDPRFASSWAHCRGIVERAEAGGFDNILLPSGYTLGIDTTAFAAAMAAMTRRIRLLMAVRIGENWPPQLARQIATIDQIAGGRLTVNIISSEMPGESLAGPARYARTLEAMQILRTLLSGQALSHRGEFWQFDLAPPRLCTPGSRVPPFYFGGLSPEAREVAARGSDVYLMWPDTMPNVRALIADVRARAAQVGRTLRFGYRVHVIVRDTEQEACAAAAHLLSRLDDATGAAIRAQSLDSRSAGVAAQHALREAADRDGFAEEQLWTGIGRARSGCGAAIVGDPDQVLAKLRAYQAEGIDAFILSGYPHGDACDRFARDVLPRLAHAPLAP